MSVETYNYTLHIYYDCNKGAISYHNIICSAVVIIIIIIIAYCTVCRRYIYTLTL